MLKEPYRLEFWNGPFDGAVRYYSSFKIALREGNRYLNETCRNYPDRCVFAVYRLVPSYSPHLVYESHLVYQSL